MVKAGASCEEHSLSYWNKVVPRLITILIVTFSAAYPTHLHLPPYPTLTHTSHPLPLTLTHTSNPKLYLPASSTHYSLPYTCYPNLYLHPCRPPTFHSTLLSPHRIPHTLPYTSHHTLHRPDTVPSSLPYSCHLTLQLPPYPIPPVLLDTLHPTLAYHFNK